MDTGMSAFIARECFYCGPRLIIKRSRTTKAPLDSLVCPTCGLDSAEIKMIEDVRTHGFAECLRRELAHEEL